MKLPLSRIKYVGVFDLDAFLGAINGWFMKERYDVAETAHKYKVDDMEIVFDGMRQTNWYLKNLVKVQVKINGARDVEITKGPMVVKATHGRVAIWIVSSLDEPEWSKKYGGWDGRSTKGAKVNFYDFLQKIFSKYIYIYKIREYAKALDDSIRLELEPKIRQALAFETVIQHA